MSSTIESTLGHLYKDGELIIEEGTPGNCLYVIQHGKVEVFTGTAGNTVVLAELGKGDFFGEMCLFERDVRSSSVKAKGDAMILTIDKGNLYQTIQKDPSLAFRLLETLSHRIRNANRMIADLQGRLNTKNNG